MHDVREEKTFKHIYMSFSFASSHSSSEMVHNNCMSCHVLRLNVNGMRRVLLPLRLFYWLTSSLVSKSPLFERIMSHQIYFILSSPVPPFFIFNTESDVWRNVRCRRRTTTWICHLAYYLKHIKYWMIFSWIVRFLYITSCF